MPGSRIVPIGLFAFFGLGCQEDPSFRVRWEVAPADGSEAAALVSPVQCSDVGLIAVQITARDELGTVVDQRLRACFPPGFDDPETTIAGAPLSPGPYAVEVRGVRRDNVGWTRELGTLEEMEPNPGCRPEPGLSPAEQDPQCDLEALSCDCMFLEVEAEQTVALTDFQISPPPQCEDGVDNDRDGLVDDFDPSCRVGGQSATESQDISAVQFALDVSVLDGNDVATCAGLRISRFVITIDDGQVLAEPACRLDGTIFFTEELASGPHVVQVVATDGTGQALTEAKEFSIEVQEDGGGLVSLAIDFAAAEFLDPIVAPARLLVGFLPHPDAEFSRGCAPVPLTGGGMLTVEDVRIEMLGPHGEPLDPPVELSDGSPLDGQTPIACPAGELTTESLSWGEYLLEIEGRSEAGEVCFTNTGTPAVTAPNSTFSVVVPRVDPPPPSCRDCEVDGDCAIGFVCDAGICR